VSATFLVMGLTGGVWNARVPAAKSQAHLSDGTLGLALFAVPVGLVLGAALAERLVDRVGSVLLVRICGLGICAATVTPGLARNLPGLMAALFAIGAFGGTLDVSANAQGVRVEAAYGRPVMTSMHAFFSLGAILGSLAGGGFAWAGVALLPSLAAVGAVGAVIVGTAGRWLLPDRRRAAAEPDEAAAAAAPDTAKAPLDRRHVRRLVFALGVLGICGLVGEGAAGDWSAVYLRDSLGTSAGLAAVAFAAFSVTMTLGRAAGDGLIHRFGVVSVIRGCGVIATAGMILALVTRSPAVTIAGFTAFGAGLSVVVPQVFGAGGRADPARPGSGLARVVGLGYTGMTAGPAVIGLVANQIGLHLALVIPAVLAAWIAVAARALTPARGADGRDGRSQAPVRDNAYPQSHT
jgi:fucose permease